jgi:hypothetical protein
MTISLSGIVNEILQTQNLSPMCIFLARLVPDVEVIIMECDFFLVKSTLFLILLVFIDN